MRPPPAEPFRRHSPVVRARDEKNGNIPQRGHGRFNVSVDDVRAVATPALRHRVILNFEGEAEGITTEAIVRSILDAVPAPSVE